MIRGVPVDDATNYSILNFWCGTAAHRWLDNNLINSRKKYDFRYWIPGVRVNTQSIWIELQLFVYYEQNKMIQRKVQFHFHQIFQLLIDGSLEIWLDSHGMRQTRQNIIIISIESLQHHNSRHWTRWINDWSDEAITHSTNRADALPSLRCGACGVNQHRLHFHFNPKSLE